MVKDLQTGAVVNAATDSSGTLANNDSGYSMSGDISANGRYVVFESYATNLVPGDTNGSSDIFVKDLQTGATTRASTDSSGTEANSSSENPSISADGRYVAFTSNASNLVPGDTNGSSDIFVKDLQTGATTRASTDSSGAQAASFSNNAAVSADGRYVVFESYATNLVPGDTNGNWDVFIKNLQTGVLTLVSVTADGVQGNGRSYTSRPRRSLTADGRYIAFSSSATNLVSGVAQGYDNVYVKDMHTGQIAILSTDINGNEGDGDNWYGISMTADGRYVAFESYATNLVPGGVDGADDVFLAANPLYEVLGSDTDTPEPTAEDEELLADTGISQFLILMVASSMLVLGAYRFRRLKS